jgi:hypothetical protein
MNYLTECFFNDNLKEMFGLIDPDNQPGWAVRYLWIQHRFENEQFIKNYFANGHTRGLNVRTQTQHLGQVWRNHNQVFDDSGANGNLVWRVKVLNSISHSIDYIEIWRSVDIIKSIFDQTPTLKSGHQWTEQEKISLGQGIYDSGFEVRHLLPYRQISQQLALKYYQQFLEQNADKNNCIINTKYNSELNPII